MKTKAHEAGFGVGLTAAQFLIEIERLLTDGRIDLSVSGLVNYCDSKYPNGIIPDNITDACEQVIIGHYYAYKKQYGIALTWFQQAADQGHAEGEYQVGYYYRCGIGVGKSNLQLGNHYINKAAAKGLADAVTMLGMDFLLGTCGSVKDIKRAVELFEKNAHRGHPTSLLGMGLSCLPGFVEKDTINVTKALGYLRSAAEKGDPRAKFYLGRIFFTGIGNEVKANLELAAQYFQEAADQSHVPAISSLAHCYSTGAGVKKDLNKSKELYHKAMEYGDIGSMLKLSVFYINGVGGEKNISLAIECLKKAIVSGDTTAQATLDRLKEIIKNNYAEALAPPTENDKRTVDNKIIRLIQEEGYPVNVRLKDGNTLLHYAYSKRNQNLVEYLLQAEANPGIKDASGKLPADLLSPESGTDVTFQQLVASRARRRPLLSALAERATPIGNDSSLSRFTGYESFDPSLIGIIAGFVSSRDEQEITQRHLIRLAKQRKESEKKL